METRRRRGPGGRRRLLDPGRGELPLPTTGRAVLWQRDDVLPWAVLLQAAALPAALPELLVLRLLLPQAAALPAALSELLVLRQLLPQAAALPAVSSGLVLPRQVLPSPVKSVTREGLRRSL